MSKTGSKFWLLAVGGMAGILVGYLFAYGRKEKLIQTICERINSEKSKKR